MLTSMEVSLKMERLINSFKSVLESAGVLYPMLLMFNKGKPVAVEITDPAVLYAESNDLVEDPKGLDDVYVTVVAFKNESDADLARAERISIDLVRKHKPDAVGYVMTAFYKSFSVQEYKALSKEYAACMDPDSIRALTACYYIRKNRDAHIRILPFLDRTCVSPQESDELQEVLGEDAPASKRDITFGDSPWRVGDKDLEPWLKYPYGGLF